MNQLIKRDSLHNIEKVFPQTFIDAIKDKETGVPLNEVLSSFNMYFVAYTGTKEETRKQVPNFLRREGLWLTYVDYDHNIIVEWYNSVDIDDYNWGIDFNWRVGNNYLVGDISITSDGNWVINGEVTEVKAQGEPGVTPLIRVADLNKLEVSYTEGKTWSIISDYIAAWFRWENNTIQISRDNKNTWSDLSPEFTTSLAIEKYVKTTSELPENIKVGTIYMVGPINDKYHLYVFTHEGWKDNGEFNGLPIGLVQELGNSKTEAVSQDLLTREIQNVYNSMVVLSEAEYDSLENKDPNKFYFVYEIEE